MASPVFWGSPQQAHLDGKETLPAKLDLILENLHIRDRVSGQRVAIKMHLGGDLSYSIIHPVFVRKVVDAVLAGGGKPFVTDLPWSTASAARRGYTSETLGCPVFPSTGIDEKWVIAHPIDYKGVTSLNIGGAIEEADFLIDLAHVKGHPNTGWGAAIKNLALGCVDGKTRSIMHDVSGYTRYYFKENCPDEATRIAIRESCPFGAIVDDKSDPDGLHIHWDKCNECGRCFEIGNGILEIRREHFMSFLELNAIVASEVLSTFAPRHAAFINIATHMTPVCDCFGFTGMPILPDAGVFGSDDLVALEMATLDMIAKTPIIEENLPGVMEIVKREGHPFQWIHGQSKDPYAQLAYAEKLGLGSREYELVDILPYKQPDFKKVVYINTK